ncbi:MAG: hypothetical protein C0456_06340 [Hyphomonas sp.]|nr:hypothetical protein [Hyphomonas sp.]
MKTRFPTAIPVEEVEFADALARLRDLDGRIGDAPFDSLAIDPSRVSTLEEFLKYRDKVILAANSAINFDGYAPLLADLFELPHYNAKNAVARKASYLPLGRIAVGRLEDRKSKGGLRFVMALARICEHAGDVDTMVNSYALLDKYLRELGDAITLEMAQDKTDHLLAAKSADHVCGWFANAKGPKGALALASFHRCQACRACKAHQFDEVRLHVHAARGHLGNAANSKDREQIRHYLDMMIIAADWHQRKSDAATLKLRIHTCIDQIEAIDPRDKPLIVGLYSLMLQSSAELPSLNGNDTPRKEQARNAARLALAYSAGSVPTFCAFDLRSIQEMANDALRFNR